jgi:hypothetical protein
MNKILDRKDIIYSLIISLVISILIILISFSDLPFTGGDAPHYITLAEQGPMTVQRPHSTRILPSHIVHLLHFMMNTHKAFLLLGILSLVIFNFNVICLIRMINYPFIVIFFIVFNPLVQFYFIQYYIPDLFYNALLSSLLLLSVSGFYFLSSIIMILLYLTRETTIILSIIIIAILYYNNKRKELYYYLIATLLGIFGLLVVKQFAGPNIWGLAEPVYLIIRIPYHTFQNIFGIPLVTNAIPYCKPILNIELPKLMQLGKIKSVGICSWNYEHLLFVISTTLSVFSIGPLLLIMQIYKKYIKCDNLWILIISYYGLTMFIASFFISVDIKRVIGYGWPLFWVAIPFMGYRIYHEHLFALWPLLIYYINDNWANYIISLLLSYFNMNNSRICISIITIIICVIFYYMSFKYIRRQFSKLISNE